MVLRWRPSNIALVRCLIHVVEGSFVHLQRCKGFFCLDLGSNVGVLDCVSSAQLSLSQDGEKVLWAAIGRDHLKKSGTLPPHQFSISPV